MGHFPHLLQCFYEVGRAGHGLSLAVHHTQHFLRMAAAAALEARGKNPSFLWLTHENTNNL